MYEIHDTHWLEIGFIACALLIFVIGAVAQYRKVNIPNWVFIPFFAAAFIQMLVLIGLQHYDESRLRQELKEVDPHAVTHLVVSSDGRQREIADIQEANSLFGQLREVANIAAHHSHPVKIWEVRFSNNKGSFSYKIGRDSSRPNEYWIMESARAGQMGREIGRVQSAQMEKVLESLLP